jgi:hypothetical protein
MKSTSSVRSSNVVEVHSHTDTNQRPPIVLPEVKIGSKLAVSKPRATELEDFQYDDIVLRPCKSGTVTDPLAMLELGSSTSYRRLYKSAVMSFGIRLPLIISLSHFFFHALS